MKKHRKIIFFDLFGVLLGTDQAAVINHVAKRVDVPYLQAREILQGEIYLRLERGEIRFKQYFQDIQYALPHGDRLDYEDFKSRWMRTELSELPTVNILPELEKQTRLYIISNATNNHMNYLKNKFDLFKHFTGIITSQDAGVPKPRPGIFEFALLNADVSPTDSLFIDDSYVNVRTALELGIHAHHYTDFEDLQTFLRQRFQ